MKKIGIIILSAICPLLAVAQAAPDALNLSQPQLRGSARFLGMGGAFGALGGDISVLNYNPGGIGIYRSSDLALTLDLDIQSTQATNAGTKYGATNRTEFDVNNFGYVGAFRTGSELMPYFNFGVSYNRSKTFKRRHSGAMARPGTSLSNLVASYTTALGYGENDLLYTDRFNPYTDGNAPWISILAYDSYLITPNSTGGFNGLYGSGTDAYSEFEVIEEGKVDEYSINFGGNIANSVFWGLGVGITDLEYRTYNYYGEALGNAYIADDNHVVRKDDGAFGLENNLRTFGTGFNFKMGAIFKPINELRLGFAFHTPTFYSLKDEYIANINYDFNTGAQGTRYTNDKYIGETWYKLNTPWKIIASAATVLDGCVILSADYEWNGYSGMRLSNNNGREYIDLSNQIREYYKSTHTVRVGGEYRFTKNFSLRAGYSYQTSPVNDEMFDNKTGVATAGTIMSYTLPKSTQYYSAGLGYRYKNLYTDLTYMMKKHDFEYHAFAPDEYGHSLISPTATISSKNNHIVWTLGVRF